MFSLGGSCAVAYQLNKYKKRNGALPFDWTKISASQLKKVLSLIFKNYENLELKKKSDNHPNFEKKTDYSLILKNEYKIQFAHELCCKEEIEAFKERLIIRIERFKQLVKPKFIRLETKNLSTEQMNIYLEIEKELEKYFPQGFTMILISKNRYQSNNTQWIELNDFESDWRYPSINWKQIFN